MDKANRTKNIRIGLCVDEKESSAILHNMKQAGIKSKSDYIRQMCVFGKIIRIEDADIKRCYNELNRIGVNLNQMTKIANETGSIYADDIEMIKSDLSNIISMLNLIYAKIDRFEKELKASGFETLYEKIRRIYNEK